MWAHSDVCVCVCVYLETFGVNLQLVFQIVRRTIHNRTFKIVF